MRSSFAILSVLATTALADDVVSFFWPGGYEGADPVATITTVNPTATGMRIACPTGTDSFECGWGDGLDVSIIDGTKYQATIKGDEFDMSINCDFNSKAAEMTCTADFNDQKPKTGVLSGSELAFVTATVVSGAEMLSASASATTTAATTATGSAKSSAAAASTGPKMSPSASASGTAAGSEASKSASATSSASLSESTGAAARFGIEGSALLILAGAAALNVW